MLSTNENLIRRSLLSSCLVISSIIVLSSLLVPLVDQTIDSQNWFNLFNVLMLLLGIFGYWMDYIWLIQIAFFSVLAVFSWLMTCLTLVLFERYPEVLIAFFFIAFNAITIGLYDIIVV